MKLQEKPKNAAIVVWIDAAQYEDDETSLEAPCTTISIGFLLENSRRQIRLAQTYHAPFNQYRDVLVIPKGAVQKVVIRRSA